MLNFILGVIVGLLVAILDGSRFRVKLGRAYEKMTAQNGTIIEIKSELEKAFQDEL